jgi:hypothetical protein
MANVPVTFAPGDRLAHVGALITAPAGHRIGRGLVVRVRGTALVRGLVQLTRVRARPWSARLAPWQACGWEHALCPDGDALTATLRYASAPAAHESPRSPRQLLALAVWVEIEGHARAAGDGDLQLTITPCDEEVDGVHEIHAIRVQPDPAPDVLSAWLAWDATLAERAESLRPLLDGFARELSRRTQTARALAARGTARRALYLRAGCVVFGECGVSGDARFESLWEGLGRGSLERLQFVPASLPVMDLCVGQAPRVRNAPVEMVVSFDRAALGDSIGPARDTLVSLLDRAGDATAGFVAEHRYVPSLADQTPWEQSRGFAPARTLDAVRSRPRIEVGEAIAYRGPPPSAE